MMIALGGLAAVILSASVTRHRHVYSSQYENAGTGDFKSYECNHGDGREWFVDIDLNVPFEFLSLPSELSQTAKKLVTRKYTVVLSIRYSTLIYIYDVSVHSDMVF